MFRNKIAGIIILILLAACTQPAATPTEQPTLQSVESVPASPAQNQQVYESINACDNPFYPHIGAAWWETSDGSIYAVVSSEGDMEKATALVKTMDANNVINYLHYTCVNGQIDLISIGGSDENGNEANTQTIDDLTNGTCEAITLVPPVTTFLSKGTWKQCDVNCRITAQVQLITDIGTYDTIRVDCDNGTAKNYVYGLGLIRTCTVDGCLEVTAYTLPY